MAIQIRTYNELLGAMVRKIVADTPLNDINVGSVLLTLLEAAAQNDFENNAAILNLLELLTIDALRNNDLDQRAADYGLERIPAQKASGFVTISDSSITKRSAGLYQVKLPPIAGQTTIFVNDASDFAATGQIYIGRGTPNFEGPISYSSIVDNGTFFEIHLDSALEKDHLISDVVVDSQGTTDRLIPANTTIQVPANNQNPLVEFSTLRDAVIPAGEDTISGVAIVAKQAGSQANAGINTITTFSALPFVGAKVTNTTALTDGTDVETDDELRERIKSFPSTLARGTASAITAAIIGVSDPDEAKQVASAVITEPPAISDPSILYIDDGSGFEPSFTGQSVDSLINNASGKEEFLQLANFPLTRPQAINTVDAPFQITEGMQLRVLVDGIEETVTFDSTQFSNIASATLAEIIIAINDQSTTFKATFTSNTTRILLFPVAHDAETIQVAALRSTDDEDLFANTVLKFPTNQFSQISLYQNNELLRERETAATVLSNPYFNWNILTSGNLIISVDGTPAQNVTFNTTDFGGIAFESLGLSDWVTAINSKFAGITATATTSGRMQIISNKEGASSALEIIGGDYFDKMFSGQATESVGQNSDFRLNRQNGNLQILREINVGDSITAGIADAKGTVVSGTTPTGNYNVSTDSDSRPAEIVVVDDATEVSTREDVTLIIGNSITVTDEGNDVMRIMSDNTVTFAKAQPNDFIYITSRGGTGLASEWIHPDNTGLYKIISKGEHLTAGTDTYVEVKNVGIVDTGFAHLVESADDIQVFKSTGYPQLWKGVFTATPAASAIQEVVDSLNDNLVNNIASVFKTNSIKMTSTTENGGSIAIPVSVGNASLLFETGIDGRKGNPSHVANRVPISDNAVSLFKRTTPTATDADGVTGKVVWLDRVTYTDIKGELTASAVPGEEGVDTYSEELESTTVLEDDNVSYDDIIAMTDGPNKGHYRSIRDKLVGDVVGTQHGLPRTLLDHTVGDKFSLFRPLAINPEDSIIFILDQDSVSKTIDVPMSRLGRVNTSFSPTSFSFSADDADNEPGITFSNLQVWGKDTNGTEFKDYGLWFRARNWYVSGGATSGGAAMIVRANEYGPHGENYRFRMEYPVFANQPNIVNHVNTPQLTDVTYFFGSGANRVTGVAAGTQFTVTDLGSDNYRYTFVTPGIDLSTTVVGDCLSALSDSGLTAGNTGQFRINAVDDTLKTLDIYNPDGVATTPGNPEVTLITTVDDVVGTPTVSNITAVANTANALDGTYFVINDAAGTVAVYYNSGTPNPGAGALGVDRVIEVALASGDADTLVATKTTAVVTTDLGFSASPTGAIMTITNTDNGAFAIGADGSTATGFAFGGTVGTADVTINGKYFILQDAAGTVAFWYDLTGGTSEPLHGASRSVEISTVAPGDTAATIATKTAVVIAGDAAFASATVSVDEITVTDAQNGVRAAASAGTSTFTVVEDTPGADDGVETVSIPTSFNIFELLNKAASEVVEKINESDTISAVAVGDDSLEFEYATREEIYTPAGVGDYSVSLGFGHDPNPASSKHDCINFYDGQFFVKIFENTNPNFALKSDMILQGIAPSVYSIDSAPNPGTSDLGEFFKLVPVTLDNQIHHFTQKALSQLPIVSNVSISNAIRKIQIKSKLLGSEGAVEVVGGNANSVPFSIFGEAQEAVAGGVSYVEARTAAFPVTMTKGDLVTIQNSKPVPRLSRLQSGDTVDVVRGIGNDTDYRWNAKTTNVSPFVRFTITDVSATYARPAGTVWRWEHNDGGSYVNITDKTLGTPALPVDDELNDGIGGTNAPALETEVIAAGDASVLQNFRITVSDVPTQADYFTFESASGTKFAVWYDVDAVGTAPTNPSYIAANHQIKVEILSSDTEDEIISKTAVKLGDTIDAATVAFQSEFSFFQTEGATFDSVNEGDLLMSYGSFAFGTTTSDWNSGNVVGAVGNGNFAGFPIIAVDAVNRYVDVVNFLGTAMTDVATGNGTIQVNPTPVIKWEFNHSAKVKIVDVTVVGGIATVTTLTPHRLVEGETATISDNGIASIDAQPVTVLSVPTPTSFTFASGSGDTTLLNGNVISAARTPTRYRLESLGFNNLMRLAYVDGDAPGFTDLGAAVDDTLVISGNTFTSNNAGRFRILAVDNTSIIFKNDVGTEELNTIRPFNNLDIPVTWVANSNLVIGTAGSFKNINIGDWVKKPEDDDTLYVQVVALQDSLGVAATAEDAVQMLLGDTYSGTSGIDGGVAFDQNTDVGKGVYIDSFEDVLVFEGDASVVGDKLFADNISNPNWFNPLNSGVFEVTQLGTDPSTYSPFVRVSNAGGTTQSGVNISVSTNGFFLIESEDDKFSSVRQVEHLAIDDVNANRRAVFMTPATRVYKMSQSNGTQIVPLGKMNYSTDVVTGIDGYTYYTGLLRTVQRIVDGFEPDSASYPGRRAVGGLIEILPPLIKRIVVSIEVTTNEGVNLSEISNDIKSAVINYVNRRGVGEDVILSEITVAVMQITGVAAVTFNVPAPSTERIFIADNEKAFIEPNDISVA